MSLKDIPSYVKNHIPFETGTESKVIEDILIELATQENNLIQRINLLNSYEHILKKVIPIANREDERIIFKVFEATQEVIRTLSEEARKKSSPEMDAICPLKIKIFRKGARAFAEKEKKFFDDKIQTLMNQEKSVSPQYQEQSIESENVVDTPEFANYLASLNKGRKTK